MRKKGKGFWKISVNIHWLIRKVIMDSQISSSKGRRRVPALEMVHIEKPEDTLLAKIKWCSHNTQQIRLSKRSPSTMVSMILEMATIILKCWFHKLMIWLFLHSIQSCQIHLLLRLNFQKSTILSTNSTMILIWWRTIWR